MASFQSDPNLELISDRLRAVFGSHTAILYGSRARGDATSDSDYDIIAFRDGDDPVRRQSGQWGDALVDIFSYPTSVLTKAGPDFLHVRGGRILFQRDRLGETFLANLDVLHRAGPERLPDDQIAALKVWAWKMLRRASHPDIEGHYRRAWLLMSQLENYFTFKGEWFPGSKAAFIHLQKCDPATYQLFEVALQPGAAFDDVAALITRVNGPSPLSVDLIEWHRSLDGGA